MQSLLKDLESVILKTQSHAATLLNKGCEKLEIQEKIRIENIDFLSEELFQLYNWHNGMSDSSEMLGKLEIFPNGFFLSIETAISVYIIYKEKWNNLYFPLFTNNGGDFLLFGVQKKENVNPIYLYSPTVLLSLIPIQIYDSIENLFTTVLECYKEGVYYFVNDLLEVDYEKELIISKSLNPKSEFWKEEEN